MRKKADSVWIIDATIAHGVDRHPLDTFLRVFTLKDGSYPEFIVKRVKDLDADGKPVFQSEPMNWLAPDGTMPPYWEWLFGQLGMDVPQGVPGTNPQRMSESKLLVEVHSVLE